LAFKTLKPFVDRHLGDLQSVTIGYKTKRGTMARGIKAEIIPKICEVWLDADEEVTLGTRQKRIAKNAKMLMRALAHTGIIALVDEATGYQDVRARDALAKIFTEFLAADRQKWTLTFPLDFYKEIYRLRGWKFEPWNTKRPSVIASWTDNMYPRNYQDAVQKLRQAVIATMAVRQPPRTAQKGVLDALEPLIVAIAELQAELSSILPQSSPNNKIHQCTTKP